MPKIAFPSHFEGENRVRRRLFSRYKQDIANEYPVQTWKRNYGISKKLFGNQLENVPKMAIFDLFFAVAKGDDSSAAFMALSSAILTPIWGGICLF